MTLTQARGVFAASTEKLLYISEETGERCVVVRAEVIKCILLSRFPKAALTQRQLLLFFFFFPHNIFF